MADQYAVVIKYDVVGFKEMEAGVARLGEPPGFETIGKLEGVLADQFESSQEEVHRITNSLALSGKPSSDYDGKAWTGEISYGGESAGINNPVTYAQAEVARHGTHAAFLRNLYGQTYNEAYTEAIESFYHGSSGDGTV